MKIPFILVSEGSFEIHYFEKWENNLIMMSLFQTNEYYAWFEAFTATICNWVFLDYNTVKAELVSSVSKASLDNGGRHSL
jgi:hypothetical protein